MSLYTIGQQVWVKPFDSLGTVAEANYVGKPRKASYIVRLKDGGDSIGIGSDGLRAADWGCDACGRYLAGVPYATAPDGEYPNGLAFCFLCAKQS